MEGEKKGAGGSLAPNPTSKSGMFNKSLSFGAHRSPAPALAPALPLSCAKAPISTCSHYNLPDPSVLPTNMPRSQLENPQPPPSHTSLSKALHKSLLQIYPELPNLEHLRKTFTSSFCRHPCQSRDLALPCGLLQPTMPIGSSSESLSLYQ